MTHRFSPATRLRRGAAALALGFALATAAQANGRVAALTPVPSRPVPEQLRAPADPSIPEPGAPVFGFVEFEWPADEGVPGFAGWRPRPAPTLERQAGR